MPKLPVPVLASPLIRRLVWHVRRVGGQLDRRFFLSLLEGIVVFVAITAVAITALEKPWTLESTFDSFNWGIATVLGQGDPGFVTSPGGRVISWLLILFGVAMLGMITGALVALVIDFLLKEGQGLGASGYRDHIVVCGWNATARDLIAELRGDDYKMKVVVLADLEKNPAGAGVYFVRGDPTNADDLGRAGITEASAALVFPSDGSDDADMRSILTVMAIESVAPGVRTVAEVNNPRHEPHFRRAEVDELLVTSKVASHLLARSALYPGSPRSSPTSCRAARAPSSTGSPCPTSTSGSPSTRFRRACAATTRRRCCRSTAAVARSSIRRPTSSSNLATTPSWSRSRSARWHR